MVDVAVRKRLTWACSTFDRAGNMLRSGIYLRRPDCDARIQPIWLVNFRSSSYTSTGATKPETFFPRSVQLDMESPVSYPEFAPVLRWLFRNTLHAVSRMTGWQDVVFIFIRIFLLQATPWHDCTCSSFEIQLWLRSHTIRYSAELMELTRTLFRWRNWRARVFLHLYLLSRFQVDSDL